MKGKSMRRDNKTQRRLYEGTKMGNPLRLLILDNCFTFGGAVQSLTYLLRSLDRRRFEPILVSGQPRETLADHFDCTWYHYVPRLPWVNDRIYRKIVALWPFRFRQLRKVLNMLRFVFWIVFITTPEAFRYYRLGRKHGVGLVHLNNLLGSQLAGILAAKILRVPCVAHLRDFEVVHPVTRFYASLIDHHIAISEAIRDNLKQLGVPDSRITVVHDALDLNDFESVGDIGYLYEEFGLVLGQPVFGLFGRLVEWKGIREFILAVHEVLKIIPEAKAFVVGDHSDGDEGFFRDMQLLAADQVGAGKVIFTGYRKDVPALMGMMNVIVHASTRPEPFGMVIIEGMAMKKPIVATRAGGVLDIVVDGETGMLVDMGDVKAMGQAICTLLQQHEMRKSMGIAGWTRVLDQFNNCRYACQMETIYQYLMEAT